MRHASIFLFTIFSLLFICSGMANASGFGLYEYSARGVALGGSTIARKPDPSVVATNPAAITQLEGLHTSAGFSSISPIGKVDVQGGKSRKNESNIEFVPNAYLTNQIDEDWWFGFGMFTRYGLSTEYESSWEGRYNVIYAGIKSISANPNFAYKITDSLSASVGAEINWLEFTNRKNIDPTGGAAPSTATDISAKLKGDSLGLGATLGLHYKPFDFLSLGASYRSQMKHQITGNVKFDNTGALGAAGFFPDTTANGRLILPDSVNFGVAVEPFDNLSIEAGAIWTRWSTYDALNIHYGDPLNPTNPDSDLVGSVKNWKNTMRYNIGVEYTPLEWLDLRAGYVFDESPINDSYADYMVPANDRHIYSLGAGVRYDEWTFDAAYAYLWMKARDIDARAADNVVQSRVHRGRAHIISLSVSYEF